MIARILSDRRKAVVFTGLNEFVFGLLFLLEFVSVLQVEVLKGLKVWKKV